MFKYNTYSIQFSRMTLNNVELHPDNVYSVKARGVLEALKKASKQAGVGDQWRATNTHKLIKL